MISSLVYLGAMLGTGFCFKAGAEAGDGFVQSAFFGIAAGLCFFVIYVCGAIFIGSTFGLMRGSLGWVALRLFLVGAPTVLVYGFLGFCADLSGTVIKSVFLALWAAPIGALFYYWEPFLRWLFYRG